MGAFFLNIFFSFYLHDLKESREDNKNVKRFENDSWWLLFVSMMMVWVERKGRKRWERSFLFNLYDYVRLRVSVTTVFKIHSFKVEARAHWNKLFNEMLFMILCLVYLFLLCFPHVGDISFSGFSHCQKIFSLNLSKPIFLDLSSSSYSFCGAIRSVVNMKNMNF